MSDLSFRRPWWTRRGFLQSSAAVIAGVYGLPGRLGHAAEIPDEFDGSKFQLKALEANPKSGGVLRYGILNRPPHYDVHQSGTIGNIGTQGCMFDNLIRRDPRDGGKTIIPDLAHSWEIAKDGKTYTFFLRKGVQFHDGAELTAEDVKATFDRIAKPPQGISIPRSILFKAVSEINAKDPYTIEFKLAEPRPKTFIMLAIASGWNVIVSKKTLEDNNYNLRKLSTYPGTGPFRTMRYVENEVRVVEKNPNYWNKGLPYLDGIEFYNLLPFSPELGSAILSGRCDYIRITDPVTARKAKATPGLSTTAFNQSVIQGTWVNSKRKPFDDPRVRRALHLAFDRPVLIDVVKDVRRCGSAGSSTRSRSSPHRRRSSATGLATRPTPAPPSRRPAHCWPPRVTLTASRDWISWSATSPVSSYGRRLFRRCCKRGSTSNAICVRSSNRSGSTTPRTAISTWPSEPSCRPCSTHRIISMPGIVPAVRRTIRSGTTKSSMA